MPNYTNPPIEEAICEFQFVPPKDNAEWDLTIPGKLQVQKELEDYSGPSRQQHIQSVAASNVMDVAVTNALFRVQLPTKDGKSILSVGPYTLGVSVLRPYEGWKKFRLRIINALETYTKVARQTTIKRIGLRYINRVVAPSVGASSASKYLTGVQTMLSGTTETNRKIDGQLTAINARHEFETSDKIKLFVTLATIDPTTPKTSEYLLDIDVVCDHLVIDGLDEISSMMDKLHDIEGGIFEALITNDSRKLFDAA